MLQAIKDSIKLSLRSKDILIWTMLFPLLMSILFYLAFNKLDEADMLKSIPVAVVENEEYENNEAFGQMIDTLTGGENPLLAPVFCDDEAQAMTLLKNGEVEGCIRMKDGAPHLSVKEEGLNQTILMQVLNQYQQTAHGITQAMTAMQEQQGGADPAQNAQAMAIVMAALEESSETSMVEHTTLTRNQPSDILGYFYSLLAMVCLFGSFQGVTSIYNLQANQSPLGARRCISPRKYGIEMVGSIAGGTLVHLAATLAALLFMAFVLKIDFGGRLGWAALGCVVGSLTGISLGTFLGSFTKLNFNSKVLLCVTVSLVMCFLSGMMIGGMNYWVQQNIPLLGWINPAARLVAALHSLYYYDSLAQYFLNLGLLTGFFVLFFALTALRLRRYQYESI